MLPRLELLTCRHLRHGTNGLTSLPKEDMFDFFPLELRWISTLVVGCMSGCITLQNLLIKYYQRFAYKILQIVDICHFCYENRVHVQTILLCTPARLPRWEFFTGVLSPRCSAWSGRTQGFTRLVEVMGDISKKR